MTGCRRSILGRQLLETQLLMEGAPRVFIDWGFLMEHVLAR